MDQRGRRGRGGGRFPNSRNHAGRETAYSSENSYSRPMSMGNGSSRYSHANAPMKQYWRPRDTPVAKDISSGGENSDLVGEVNRVTEPVTPTVETCLYVSVSHPREDYPLSNSIDRELKPWGRGRGQMVDEGERSGDCLRFQPSSGGSSARRHIPVAGANSPSEVTSGNKDDMSSCGSQNIKTKSGDNSSKKFDHMKTFNHQNRQSSDAKEFLSGIEKLNLGDEPVTPFSAFYDHASVSSSQKDDLHLRNISPFSNSNVEEKPLMDGSPLEKSPQKKTKDSRSSDKINQSSGVAFDICPPRSGPVPLNPSLLDLNRMKKEEAKRSKEGQSIIKLRSGMILLKKFISFNDQVNLVKGCRDLGLGPGGFYEPGYSDGGKLHLKMMCLGKNWDPEKRAYGDKRESDGAKPPLIPNEFLQLVKRAMEASHSYLGASSKSPDVLPSMSPNICIVNFYTSSGRLGLHQDKDESKESINRGLPVVSFSIGDTAEFSYGDNPDKTDKVDLESGDVLIFGGKSRLIFHGVTSIRPDKALKALLAATHLRAGRLNLTFRES